MNLDNLYLTIYILLWFFTFINFQRKCKDFNGGSAILLLYMIFSVASLFLFNSPQYYKGDTNLTLFPFIYLFFALYISIKPILKFNKSKIDTIQKPPKFFISSICILLGIAIIFILPDVISGFRDGLLKIVIDSAVGAELYAESAQDAHNSGKGISNLFGILFNALSDIGILLLLYFFTLKKRPKIFTVILFISLIITMVSPISKGDRTKLVLTIITLIITYFSLMKYIVKDVNKKIKIVGILLLLAISIPFIALTLSRFSARDPLYSVNAYAGQSILNFNKYGLDAGGIRYGDRTVPLFKKMLLFDNVPNNYIENRLKYPDMKMDDSVFYTFVGDFTLDYGPYLAIIIIMIFSIWVHRRITIRSSVLKFHQLVLVYISICITSQGAMYLFSYGDIGGNIKILTLILIYFYLKIKLYGKTSKNNSFISTSVSSSS